MNQNTDTSRISFTAQVTGYIWFINGLSPDVFVTRLGKRLYNLIRPGMLTARHVLGVADLETYLMQRHLVIDHLLEQAVAEGVGQVLEPGCGLSPRGFRFKKKHPRIRYLEADLPHMARWKKELLEQAGLMSDGHEILTCNILDREGPDSLEQIAATHLDPDVPTALITEGVIGYFDRASLEPFWKAVGGLLSETGGCYLTDNVPILRGGLASDLMRLWRRVIGLTTRGRMHAHFETTGDAERAFQSLGFKEVIVHKPENLAGEIDIPVTRLPTSIQVIQAMGSGPGRKKHKPMNA
jgi:O-methyltransferase involved in polyketide biosynthesis